MLARRASYDKKTLARQVIPLAPGYRTALSSRPVKLGDKLLVQLDVSRVERSERVRYQLEDSKRKFIFAQWLGLRFRVRVRVRA